MKHIFVLVLMCCSSVCSGAIFQGLGERKYAYDISADGKDEFANYIATAGGL